MNADPTHLAALHSDAMAPEPGWDASAFGALLARPTARVVARREGFILSDVVAGEAEILMVAVTLAARREGHGAALLAALIAELQPEGVTRMVLEVAEDNAAARALYARAGFTPIGRRRDYYRRRDGHVDALCLELQL